MNVERLLDWAAVVLEEPDLALTTQALSDHLTHQLQVNLAKLEVLLSLDKRFLRSVDGYWQLNRAHSSEAGAQALVDRALVLRQQAVEALLTERQDIKDRLVSVRSRLGEIDEHLVRLGHAASAAAPPPLSQDEEYSLEYHLRRLPARARELATQVHDEILSLPGASAKFNKYHIAYSTRQRFAMLMLRRQKVVILIKAGAELQDPQGWTRDATSRRLGLERMFDLESVDGLDYAMRLIGQAYQKVSAE